MDKLPPEYVAAFCELARRSSDNTMLIPWEVWRENFMQDAPEAVARSFWERLSPEPNQVNLDKVDLNQFYSLSVPKSFIYCRQDKALPPGQGAAARFLSSANVFAFWRIQTARDGWRP